MVGKRAWLALTGVALSAPTAWAQQSGDTSGADTPLEEIVTIGTRRTVGRSALDSPVPVDVVGDFELLNSGITETNDLLARALPSFNFPQPSVTDGTDSVRPAQLRGLAPDQTLVLVNGKRRHTSALLNLNGSVGRGSTAVDLNQIPVSAIKRIEVLRDGAAAQYGSDAIAGVINIVLKDADEGGSVSVTYGAHITEMDGVPNLESVSIDGDGNLAFVTGDDRERTDGQTLTLRGNMGSNWAAMGSYMSRLNIVIASRPFVRILIRVKRMTASTMSSTRAKSGTTATTHASVMRRRKIWTSSSMRPNRFPMRSRRTVT